MKEHLRRAPARYPISAYPSTTIGSPTRLIKQSAVDSWRLWLRSAPNYSLTHKDDNRNLCLTFIKTLINMHNVCTITLQSIVQRNFISPMYCSFHFLQQRSKCLRHLAAWVCWTVAHTDLRLLRWSSFPAVSSIVLGTLVKSVSFNLNFPVANVCFSSTSSCASITLTTL